MNKGVSISQVGNIGRTQGVHYGDNIYYNSKTDKTLKHRALETHDDTKLKWVTSKTCDWLLQTNDFQTWTSTEAEYSVLWLHGRPGCGKSTLMSRMIESTREKLPEARGPNHPHLLYFYIGYGDEKETGKLDRKLLLTFWEQASPNPVEVGTNTFGDNPPVDLVSGELRKLLSSSQRNIYIFIDALDQLPEDSKYNVMYFLESLAQHSKNEASGRQVKVAISSRNCRDTRKLQSWSLFEIEVTTERNKSDIQAYLAHSLKSTLLDTKSELKDEVWRKLSTDAGGIFLWASLQAQNICQLEKDFEVQDALKTLIPSGKMKEMYQNYAQAIDSIEISTQKQIAKRTMALLAHSAGSMPVDALIEAVSLNTNGDLDPKAHEDLTADPAAIAYFCRDLVRVNEKFGLFEFCHTTIYEFFSTYEVASYSNLVADLCLSYLCSLKLPDSAQNDVSWYDTGSLGLALQEHPFLLHASYKWASCLNQSFVSKLEAIPQNSHSRILDLLERLFHQDRVSEGGGNLRLALRIYLLGGRKMLPGGVGPDHIVSYFGLGRLFGNLKERGVLDLAKRDDNGLLPIHWAAQSKAGAEAAELTVKWVIEYGQYRSGHINARDNQGRTPLYYAAYHDNPEVVSLLIRYNPPLDQVNGNGETALIAACRQHRERVILQLVQAGADVAIQSTLGTALQIVSSTGCCKCAKAILDAYENPKNPKKSKKSKKSKINENCGPFGTALHVASFYGHPDLVRLLCSNGIHVRATHKTYGTAITAAATGWHPGTGSGPGPFASIIKELVKHGVDVNDKSGLVGPALRAAADHGSAELVRLLLDSGAKVRMAKGKWGTAYEAADDRGNHEIKKMLLQSDPRAAEYGGTHSSKIFDLLKIQRVVFRRALRGSSMDNIDYLISQWENSWEREMEKGDTRSFEVLCNIGTDSFQEAIGLATKSLDPSHAQKRAGDSSDRSPLLEYVGHISCIVPKDRNDEAASLHGPTHPTPFTFRRAARTFVHDPFGEQFPQAIDRMTQAAVGILERAIEKKDKVTIQLIADRWVETLDILISYPDFGPPLFDQVVRKRADQLKEYLIKADAGQEEFDGSEGLKKAATMAQAGIELLLAAIKRGTKSKRLSYVIAKIWFNVLRDIEDLGPEGEEPIRVFFGLFTRRFEEAIESRDLVNAEIRAQAAIELLRAAALQPNKNLFSQLSDALMPLWRLIYDNNQKRILIDIISRRAKECCSCLWNEKYEEALGLMLVCIGMLESAIKDTSGGLIVWLQRDIKLACQFMDNAIAHESPGRIAYLAERFRSKDLEAIFTASIRMLETTEDIQPGRLNLFTSTTIDAAEALFARGDQTFETTLGRSIDEVAQIESPQEQERRSVQITRVILAFLELALSAKERNRTVLSTLTTAASERLSVMGLDCLGSNGLGRYERAIGYLKEVELY